MLSSSSIIRMRSADTFQSPVRGASYHSFASQRATQSAQFRSAGGFILPRVTRQFAWVTVLLVGGTALVMLLTVLAFLPVAEWERYVPVATIVGTIGVVLAGITVERAGERVVRPIRRLVHSIEEADISDQSLRNLVRQAPAEVAPLLYGL